MLNPADLIDHIAVETYALGAAFRRHGDMLAVPTGQSQARWQVLRLASDGALTVPQIARRLGVSRQNVQRIANALVVEELAHYSDNPDHKSSPHLVLTSAGRGILHELSDSAAEYRDLLARTSGQVDLPLLLAQLKAMGAALATMDERVDLLVRKNAKRHSDPGKKRRTG
jgi:DNA-binding MarR family transcriptional regulator